MKRLMKILVIAGIVLTLAGTGITAASFAQGADPIRIGRYFENRLEGHHAEFVAVTTTNKTQASESSVAENDLTPEMSAGSEDWKYENGWSEDEEIAKIEILINGGTVRFEREEGCQFEILWDSGVSEHIWYDMGDQYRKVMLQALEGEEYVIQMPAEWNLKEIEVEANSGFFSGDLLSAEEIEVYAGNTAEIWFSQTGGRRISLECSGTGMIDWTAADEIPENLEAECAGDGGNIFLTMPPSFNPEEAGYGMEWDNGTINLQERTLSGKGNETKAVGPGKPYLELEAERGGTITILQD